MKKMRKFWRMYLVFILLVIACVSGPYIKREIALMKIEPQIFDGRQQVPTDKATGEVTVKGRLY